MKAERLADVYCRPTCRHDPPARRRKGGGSTRGGMWRFAPPPVRRPQGEGAHSTHSSRAHGGGNASARAASARTLRHKQALRARRAAPTASRIPQTSTRPAPGPTATSPPGPPCRRADRRPPRCWKRRRRAIGVARREGRGRRR